MSFSGTNNTRPGSPNPVSGYSQTTKGSANSKTPSLNVCLVESSPQRAEKIQNALTSLGHRIQVFHWPPEVTRAMATDNFDLVLVVSMQDPKHVLINAIRNSTNAHVNSVPIIVIKSAKDGNVEFGYGNNVTQLPSNTSFLDLNNAMMELCQTTPTVPAAPKHKAKRPADTPVTMEGLNICTFSSHDSVDLIIRHVLSLSGDNVEAFDDPLEALNAIVAKQHDLLVICEHNVEGCKRSGQLVRALKDSVRSLVPELTIFGITANPQCEPVLKNIGIDHIIVLPESFNLIDQIHRSVKKRPQKTTAPAPRQQAPNRPPAEPAPRANVTPISAFQERPANKPFPSQEPPTMTPPPAPTAARDFGHDLPSELDLPGAPPDDLPADLPSAIPREAFFGTGPADFNENFMADPPKPQKPAQAHGPVAHKTIPIPQSTPPAQQQRHGSHDPHDDHTEEDDDPSRATHDPLLKVFEKLKTFSDHLHGEGRYDLPDIDSNNPW